MFGVIQGGRRARDIKVIAHWPASIIASILISASPQIDRPLSVRLEKIVTSNQSLFINDANRSTTAVISGPGPKTGFQISPTVCRRLARVRMVNLDGSNPFRTSVHLRGVETVAL